MRDHDSMRRPDAATQLPVASYFDAELFEQEREHLFARCPRYVGHEKMVPEPGDWHTLVQEGGGRALVRDGDTVRLLSNVCRHRQALILGGRDGADTTCCAGNLAQTGGRMLCPVHHWSYDAGGQLQNAPLFEETPAVRLQDFPLQRCHGLLFEGPGDVAQELAPLFARPEFDFSDYVFNHVELHHCHYNWKTFIEVYLEDYHVGPFHPGLGQFVSCDDLQWWFGTNHSVQQVGINQALAQPGTEVYGQWHARLADYTEGKTPAFGAIWGAYYPTHMIELYPHVLVLSTLYPKGPQETLNVVEFYYPEAIAAFEPEFMQAQQAAYMETAIEDDEIAERMDGGRRALLARGTDERGPYQRPLEDGMAHFHQWYRTAMDLA